MKKNRIAALALGLLLALTLLAAPAMAAGEVSVQLQVETQLTGDTPPAGETFTYRLDGADKDTPMPDGGSTLAVTGAGTATFGAIRYTHPGDYKYTLNCTGGKTEGYTYDTRAYEVTVQVVTDDDGNLTAAVYMAREGTQGKPEKAVFVHSYKTSGAVTPPSPETPPAPDTPAALPQTSDATHNGLWLALLAASGFGMLVCLLAGSRKEKNKI